MGSVRSRRKPSRRGRKKRSNEVHKLKCAEGQLRSRLGKARIEWLEESQPAYFKYSTTTQSLLSVQTSKPYIIVGHPLFTTK